MSLLVNTDPNEKLMLLSDALRTPITVEMSGYTIQIYDSGYRHSIHYNSIKLGVCTTERDGAEMLCGVSSACDTATLKADMQIIKRYAYDNHEHGELRRLIEQSTFDWGKLPIGIDGIWKEN